MHHLEEIHSHANHVVDLFEVDSVERNNLSIDVTEYAITRENEFRNCFSVSLYTHNEKGEVKCVKPFLVETKEEALSKVNELIAEHMM